MEHDLGNALPRRAGTRSATESELTMRLEIRTEIDIDASPQVVWNVLTELSDFHDWNPFMTSADGHVAEGERLDIRIEPPGAKAMTFEPVVTVVEDAQVLEWLGSTRVPGIFDGRHRFELTPSPSSGTRFVNSEKFSGFLVRFMRRSLDENSRQGFELMNAALKTRAEAAGNSKEV